MLTFEGFDGDESADFEPLLFVLAFEGFDGDESADFEPLLLLLTVLADAC